MHRTRSGARPCVPRQEQPPITNWTQWLTRVTDHASDRDIGKRAGISHTTVSRWRNTGRAPADGVILVARAYRADPIDGLIAAGYLTEADLAATSLRNAVRHAPTGYLTEELHERAVTGRLGASFDQLRRAFRARP